MPLDGDIKLFTETTVADVLRRAKALIDAPEKIICGEFGDSGQGAGERCTYTALFVAGESRRWTNPSKKTLRAAAVFASANTIAQPRDVPHDSESPHKWAIACWHDDAFRRAGRITTRVVPILTAAFDKAIALAERS